MSGVGKIGFEPIQPKGNPVTWGRDSPLLDVTAFQYVIVIGLEPISSGSEPLIINHYTILQLSYQDSNLKSAESKSVVLPIPP